MSRYAAGTVPEHLERLADVPSGTSTHPVFHDVLADVRRRASAAWAPQLSLFGGDAR